MHMCLREEALLGGPQRGDHRGKNKASRQWQLKLGRPRTQEGDEVPTRLQPTGPSRLLQQTPRGSSPKYCRRLPHAKLACTFIKQHAADKFTLRSTVTNENAPFPTIPYKTPTIIKTRSLEPGATSRACLAAAQKLPSVKGATPELSAHRLACDVDVLSHGFTLSTRLKSFKVLFFFFFFINKDSCQ